MLTHHFAFTVLSSDNELPAPVEIEANKLEKAVFTADLNVLDPENEAIDYYESLEGMRVKITDPKVVAAPYKDTQYIASTSANGFTPRGGLMYNSYDSTGRVCVYPYACFAEKSEANVGNPEPTIGDSYNGVITGVLGYSYGNYQIEITEALPTLTHGNMSAEPSTIAFEVGKLNIVSYNLENFSKAKGKGHSSKKTPEQRATAFADHFINQLKQPDIICLIEIQDDSADTDDNMVSAQQTLNLLINKIAAIGGALLINQLISTRRTTKTAVHPAPISAVAIYTVTTGSNWFRIPTVIRPIVRSAPRRKLKLTVQSSSKILPASVLEIRLLMHVESRLSPTLNLRTALTAEKTSLSSIIILHQSVLMERFGECRSRSCV